MSENEGGDDIGRKAGVLGGRVETFKNLVEVAAIVAAALVAIFRYDLFEADPALDGNVNLLVCQSGDDSFERMVVEMKVELENMAPRRISIPYLCAQLYEVDNRASFEAGVRADGDTNSVSFQDVRRHAGTPLTRIVEVGAGIRSGAKVSRVLWWYVDPDEYDNTTLLGRAFYIDDRWLGGGTPMEQRAAAEVLCRSIDNQPENPSEPGELLPVWAMESQLFVARSNRYPRCYGSPGVVGADGSYQQVGPAPQEHPEPCCCESSPSAQAEPAQAEPAQAEPAQAESEQLDALQNDESAEI